MRAEALGFIRHSALMLATAVVKIKEEWDDSEITLSPAQVALMRTELNRIKGFLKEIEPYAAKFESVADARVKSLE